jgi:hypothetical protein
VTKEINATALSGFRRIDIQSSFVSQIAATHVKGTTGTAHSTQEPDFHAQKRVGAILFSVGTGFDGNESAWTPTSKALRTIMITLP